MKWCKPLGYMMTNTSPLTSIRLRRKEPASVKWRGGKQSNGKTITSCEFYGARQHRRPVQPCSCNQADSVQFMHTITDGSLLLSWGCK